MELPERHDEREQREGGNEGLDVEAGDAECGHAGAGAGVLPGAEFHRPSDPVPGPSISASARRWEEDGEANGALQQENVQSAGSCLPAHFLRVLWGAGGVGGSLPGFVSHCGGPNGEVNQPASWKNAQIGNAGRIGEELKMASEEEGRRRVTVCVCESN